MTTAEVEAHIRDDTVWRRPTWPLGARSGRLDLHAVHDFFDLFGRTSEGNETSPPPRQTAETPEARAMRTMELRHPVTRAAVKTRYKELVKRFHPDIHGGDKTTEEKLKIIIGAYKILMSSLNA